MNQTQALVDHLESIEVNEPRIVRWMAGFEGEITEEEIVRWLAGL